MLELRASSLADTHGIAAALASVCHAGDLIVLAGEVGAGKTAFAQGFGAALGITEPITSPTFTLVHSYDVPTAGTAGSTRPAGVSASVKVLHHADLYRLDRTTEIADLALDELAEYHGVVLVEWGDVVESMFADHLVVHIQSDLDLDPDLFAASNPGAPTAEPGPAGAVEADLGDTGRLIEISATGASWAPRWSRIVDACEAFRC